MPFFRGRQEGSESESLSRKQLEHRTVSACSEDYGGVDVKNNEKQYTYSRIGIC